MKKSGTRSDASCDDDWAEWRGIAVEENQCRRGLLSRLGLPGRETF